MSRLIQTAPCIYELEMEEGMRVPGLVIASEQMIQAEDFERPLDQVKHVAFLPGIQKYSIAMPDIHWGYGFPIGGVAAMDAEIGVISPGGVGYDINCGVRVAIAPIEFSKLSQNTKEQLLHSLYRSIPSGVGRGEKGFPLSDQDYHSLLTNGSKWCIEQGFGLEEDLKSTESNGCIDGADEKAVSAHAKERGLHQIGSIGSGNHFVEVGAVETLFDEEIAGAWGIGKGLTYVLIHSGSRGFGHQVCQDTLDLFMKKGFARGLPDPQLVAAPITSQEGQNYFKAMAAAANFAFNNRQKILHHVRKAFVHVLNLAYSDLTLIYDVCHNIAKFEEHLVDGKKRLLCVHRKGATRAFGPGAKELAQKYQQTGQPVLVPGDMGRASYILAGSGNSLTWCSCCHGAGRMHSRSQSIKTWRGKNPVEYMKSQGVLVKATSNKTILEEMPDAYKDVDEVVKAAETAKLAKRVARLKPSLVVKG